MINKIIIQSAALTNMMKVSQMTVNSAVSAKPNLSSVIWRVTERQLTLLRKISIDKRYSKHVQPSRDIKSALLHGQALYM